jgi:hypothetical protein
MATAAQIEANRKNSKRSTGPKTEAGKAMSKLNALKHGRRAKAVAPVLPQEDPAELEDRIKQWVQDMRPEGAAERKLVERAAKPSFELDCLDRREADGRSRRVQEAQTKVDDETANTVCVLGRKLLAMADRRDPPTSGPPQDDHPEASLRGLEGSAEGCRWLLDRWAELRHLFDRDVTLTSTDLYRLVRLQGKHHINAINDPDLNLQFLACEVLWPNFATTFWKECYELTPPDDPGFGAFMEWREIVDRPASEEEALAVVNGVIDGRIARLEEMIRLYEEIADEEAMERAVATLFDPGPEAEALRRRRSTLTRELRQLIELIRKMQAAREKRAAREGEAPAKRTCPVPPRDDGPSREPCRPPAIANPDCGGKPRLTNAEHAARRDEGSNPPRKRKRSGKRTAPDAKSMEALLDGELSRFMLDDRRPAGEETGPPDGMPGPSEGGEPAKDQTRQGAVVDEKTREKSTIEANPENDLNGVQDSRWMPWRGPWAVAIEPDSLDGPAYPKKE